jgi:phage-related minor tail protein
MNTEAKVVIGLETAGFEAGAKRAQNALEGVATAGGASARQIAAATRQLPAQFTDIATQLAGGQSPLLILLQQGGQIKDSFGGVGNAVRGIASAINPVTIAVGAAAAVVGTLAYAANAGAKDAAQLRDTLALTGNAAGLTADRVASIGARISQASNQTVGEAREILLSLAATGQTSSAVIESQGRAIARISDLTGKAGKDIAGAFTGQLEAPAKTAAKLNEAYNFLSVAEFKRIQTLETQKKNAEAVVLTNDLLAKSHDAQRAQLGTLEAAWSKLSKAIGDTKDNLLAIGRPDTAGSLINAQADKLAGLRQQLANNNTAGRGETKITGLGSQNDGLRAQIAQAEKRLRELARQQDIEGQNADGRSLAAAQTRAKIDELVNAKAPERQRAFVGPPTFDEMFPPAKAAEIIAQRDLNTKLRLDELDSYDQIAKAQREAENAGLEAGRRRRTVQSELVQGLVDANARAGAELISDERERGLAIIAIDRELGERRIREAGLVGAALQGALDLNTERAAISQIGLDKQIGGKIKTAADAASTKLSDSIAEGALDGFRRGGNFADIFLSELKAQFAKTILSPIIRPTVDAGNNIIAQLLAGASRLVFGGSGPLGAESDFTTNFGGPRAAGGPVEAGRSYLVGERGPELLRMGSRGGSVVPNSALGGNITLAPVVTCYIDSRSDAGQVAQLVAAGVTQGNRAVLESLRAQGLIR